MGMHRRRFIKLSAASMLGMLGGVKKLFGQEASQGKSSGAEKSFAFCVVADPHCAEGPKKGIERHGTGADKFLACFREMEKLRGAEKPDFALVLGDIHLWAFEKRLGETGLPLHVIAGNHESGRKKQQIRDLFPADFKKGGREADYYSFVHKGVRFMGVCDAGRGGEHIGQLCSEDIKPRGQCEWLENELGKAEKRKVVFAHIPPEPKGKDRNMYLSRNDSRWFNQLVEKTRPTAMFFGHQHRKTSRCKIGATPSVTLRSCCWNSGRSPLGFTVVRMTPQGVKMREVTTGQYG